jgi:hypothetical protein
MKNNNSDKARAKHIFLDHVRQGESVSTATDATGYSRKTIYKWRKESPRFAQEWDDAIEEGADVYEDLLLSCAKKGNVKAIIYGLKMKGRGADHREHTTTHQGADGEVVIYLPDNGRDTT